MKPNLSKISSRQLDILLAASLFVFSATIGLVYVATYQPVPYFLQHMFGPAVMWACGRGFENPKLSEVPELEDFLYWRRPCFDCASLPENLPVVPADPFSLSDEEWRQYHPHPEYAGWVNCQRFHKYMLMSAALLWRILGVSWHALLPLYALLYGMAALAAYCLFRLAMKRPLAFFMTLLFILAPLQLQQLPDLRDYAKAPFFISAIFIMGLLVTKPLSTKHTLLFSALCGIILGIGVGFRQDVLISLPPFIIALILTPQPHTTPQPRRSSSTCEVFLKLRLRLPAVLLFLICFLIIGGPILKVLFTQANNSSHDTLIGFTKYCDDRLGVGAALYDYGDPFLDEYTRAVVDNFNERTNGVDQRLRHYTREYDQAASQYFRALATTFPADLVTRAYASILRVLDELRPESNAPRGIENPALLTLYNVYGAITKPLLAYGRYAAALALILIAAKDLRLGLFALFTLCWFAGYPSLRFSVRHAFHLQFISFFIAGFLIQQALSFIWAMKNKSISWPHLRQNVPNYAKTIALFITITIVAIAISLWALRLYQQHTVTNLLQAYLDAPRHQINGDSYHLFSAPDCSLGNINGNGGAVEKVEVRKNNFRSAKQNKRKTGTGSILPLICDTDCVFGAQNGACPQLFALPRSDLRLFQQPHCPHLYATTPFPIADAHASPTPLFPIADAHASPTPLFPVEDIHASPTPLFPVEDTHADPTPPFPVEDTHADPTPPFPVEDTHADPTPPFPVEDTHADPTPPFPIADAHAGPIPPFPIADAHASPTPPLPVEDIHAGPTPPLPVEDIYANPTPPLPVEDIYAGPTPLFPVGDTHYSPGLRFAEGDALPWGMDSHHQGTLKVVPSPYSPPSIPASRPFQQMQSPHLIVLMLSLPARAAGQQIRVVYDSADPMWDFSRTIDISQQFCTPLNERLQIFIPIYSDSSAKFKNLEFSNSIAAKDVQLFQLDQPLGLSVLLTAIVPENWHDYPRYYQLTR